MNTLKESIKGDKIMTRYGKEIIEDSKRTNKILDILEIIQDKCNYGANLEKLTNGEKTIFFIGELEGEVNNGGFSQYFFNTSGKNTNEAIKALNDITANHTASLLEESKQIYGYGKTSEGRNSIEIDLTKEQDDKLYELDKNFYEYKDNLSDLQIKYISSYINEF